jgi:hypothetical protein
MGGQRSKRRERACNRYVRCSVTLLGALLIGIAVSTVTRAAEAPDDEFLEFLGSVDSEDKDWRDYLARTDIDKVARRVAPGNNAPAPAPNSPPATHPAPADPPSAASPANGGSSNGGSTNAGKTIAPP